MGYRFGKFARRNQKALVAGVLVAMAMLTGTVISVWMAIVATQAKNDLQEANDVANQHLLASNQAQGKMWLTRAQGMLDQKRFLSARTMAGRALGFEGFGREQRDAAFAERYRILLEPESADWSQAQRIVSGEFDHPMIWSRQGDTQDGIIGHVEMVKRVAFNPDGSVMATAGFDKTVRLWDIASGEAIGSPLRGHTSFVYDLCFDPAGDRLASVGRDGTLRLWDVSAATELRQVDTNNVPKSVAFHPDGTSIATAGDGGQIKLWTVPGLELAKALDDCDQGITGLSFSPDGIFLASSGNDKLIRIWQVPTASLHATLEGHQHEVEDLAFAPDAAVLASCGKDFTVRLWHVERSVATPVRTYHPGGIRAIQYARGGEILAASTGAGRVGIYDSVTGFKRGELVHSSDVTSIRVSPDDSLLAVACRSQQIFVWELATSTLKCEPLKGHSGKITCLGFDPTSGHLVSGSDDRSVVLWDVGAGSELWRRQNPDGVTCLEFDPSRGRFAAGNRQGTIYVWEAGSPDPDPAKILTAGERSPSIPGATTWPSQAPPITTLLSGSGPPPNGGPANGRSVVSLIRSRASARCVLRVGVSGSQRETRTTGSAFGTSLTGARSRSSTGTPDRSSGYRLIQRTIGSPRVRVTGRCAPGRSIKSPGTPMPISSPRSSHRSPGGRRSPTAARTRSTTGPTWRWVRPPPRVPSTTSPCRDRIFPLPAMGFFGVSVSRRAGVPHSSNSTSWRMAAPVCSESFSLARSSPRRDITWT